MSRPLRVNVEGGWYHVRGRGIERRRIFADGRDHEHFLELLSAMPERYGVEIHAYSLMGNHYHLLVRTPNANASAALQWLNVSYSVWFNRRRGRVGHVFQGRFGSTLVDGEGSWVVKASVYIHLNPIRTAHEGLIKPINRAEARGVVPVALDVIRERLRRLKSYPWSSYGAYAGYRRKPDWLTTDELLKRVGGAAAYRSLVNAHVARGTLPEDYEDGLSALARGSKQFLEALKQRVRSWSLEQPARRELGRRVTIDQVVAVVEAIKREKWEAFKDRYGDDGRDMVLYLARRRTGLTLRQIAEALGIGQYKTVAKAVERFGQSLASDSARRRQVENALDQLSNVET